jgi:nucleotide-binding universal stress UspA family protein
MTPIANILVPSDFSRASQQAMRLGSRLAFKLGAQLTAAHIIPSFTALNYVFPADTVEFETREARETLPLEIPQEFRERLDTRTVIKSGDVQEELLGIVNNERVDLVVMGKHGRGTLGRFFLGSTTEGLLRRMPVPVLTTSDRGTENRIFSPFDPPFHRILFATDLSENAASGLHYSAELAQVMGAQLTLLHVMHPVDPMAFENEADIHAALMGRLQKAVRKEHAANLSIITEVLRGVPHQEILRFAERASCDLIVINTQGKGFLERAVLGSTAECVIRSAQAPVLSVPAKDGVILETLAESSRGTKPS